MSDNTEQLVASIRNLIPINELAPQYQEQIAKRAQVVKFKKGKFIFKQGDQDNFSFYLLEGEVELLSDGQLHNVIAGGTDRARYAMAQLQPRQFSARVKSDSTVMQVDRKALDHILVMGNEESEDKEDTDVLGMGAAIEVDEVDLSESDDVDWVTRMLQSELFSNIPTANIHQLFALLEPVEFKAGDVVITQGESGENYYIIQEGKCTVARKPSPDGKEIKLAELKVGDSFGEEALISGATRNASVTMNTDGILMQLSKDNFIKLIKEPTLKSVSYEQATKLVGDGAVWLDVRFQNEHTESSIEGSINIPLNMLRLQVDKLQKDKKYLVICDTEGRSSTATFLLAEYGFDACYLKGGMIKHPGIFAGTKHDKQETAPVAAEVRKKEVVHEKREVSPAEKVSDTVDAEVRVQAITAELEKTNMDILRSEENRKALDAAKAKAEEEVQKKLLAERKKLEAEKEAAEADVKRKIQAEEEKLARLKQEASNRLQEEKKKLESIYAKNTEEMEKLQKMRQESENQLKKEREKLERESEEAKLRLEEARRLKKEIEASKRNMEKEALKKQKEQEELEKQAQERIKQKLEDERRKLAEQYERNSKEFENLKKEKAAAEAARKAAKEEAERIISEYKQAHDKTRAEEEKRLQEERVKLEQESRKIQETLEEIKRAKQEAGEARKMAKEEAAKLKEKQDDVTAPEEIRATIKNELREAEVRLEKANRELEDARHAEKVAETAKVENEQDLARKKEQEEILQKQLEADLASFQEELDMQTKSVPKVQSHQDHVKRIMKRARAAEEEAKNADDDLLAEISSQLGGGD